MRANHLCNYRCNDIIHYDVVYKFSDLIWVGEEQLTEEEVQAGAPDYLEIYTAQRILEFPLTIPGVTGLVIGAVGIYFSWR